MMSLDVEIGHVTICMHVVMVIGHVKMDEMNIIVVEQNVLHKLMHVYLLFNYTVICLPSERVNDDIDDCLGALDEQTACRQRISFKDSFFTLSLFK